MSNERHEIQMTSENEQSMLDAAAAAQAEADGLEVAETDEQKATREAAETAQTAESSNDDKEATDEGKKEVDSLEAKPKGEEKPDGDEGDELSEAVGIDLDAFYAEYAEKGEISEESTKTIVDALTKANFKNPEALLDQYIRGADSQAATMRSDAFAITGGEGEYASMVAWMSENIAPAELAVFNESVLNPASVKMAVAGMNAQWRAATGTAAPAQSDSTQQDNPRVEAGAVVQTTHKPINSMQQISEITGDPRYDTDPGWRKTQDARIKASMDAGLI